jgi:hypothetical protein
MHASQAAGDPRQRTSAVFATWDKYAGNRIFIFRSHKCRALAERETKVLISIGAAGILSGLVATATAARFPAYRKRLEQWGSGLFVSGIALLAIAFPMF